MEDLLLIVVSLVWMKEKYAMDSTEGSRLFAIEFLQAHVSTCVVVQQWIAALSCIHIFFVRRRKSTLNEIYLYDDTKRATVN